MRLRELLNRKNFSGKHAPGPPIGSSPLYGPSDPKLREHVKLRARTTTLGVRIMDLIPPIYARAVGPSVLRPSTFYFLPTPLSIAIYLVSREEPESGPRDYIIIVSVTIISVPFTPFVLSLSFSMTTQHGYCYSNNIRENDMQANSKDLQRRILKLYYGGVCYYLRENLRPCPLFCLRP